MSMVLLILFLDLTNTPISFDFKAKKSKMYGVSFKRKIKEEPLMLGGEMVGIESFNKGGSFQSDAEYVVTERGKILAEDCLYWYNENKKIRNHYLPIKHITGNATIKLGEFDTKIPITEGDLCEIGCIKNIKWEQIENVIKAIKI